MPTGQMAGSRRCASPSISGWRAALPAARRFRRAARGNRRSRHRLLAVRLRPAFSLVGLPVRPAGLADSGDPGKHGVRESSMLARYGASASYCIYAIHLPLISMANGASKVAPLPPPATVAIVIAAILAAAPLVHAWFDAPVRRWLKPATARRDARHGARSSEAKGPRPRQTDVSVWTQRDQAHNLLSGNGLGESSAMVVGTRNSALGGVEALVGGDLQPAVRPGRAGQGRQGR